MRLALLGHRDRLAWVYLVIPAKAVLRGLKGRLDRREQSVLQDHRDLSVIQDLVDHQGIVAQPARQVCLAKLVLRERKVQLDRLERLLLAVLVILATLAQQDLQVPLVSPVQRGHKALREALGPQDLLE